jgi:hypothetical protein
MLIDFSDYLIIVEFPPALPEKLYDCPGPG